MDALRTAVGGVKILDAKPLVDTPSAVHVYEVKLHCLLVKKIIPCNCFYSMLYRLSPYHTVFTR